MNEATSRGGPEKQANAASLLPLMLPPRLTMCYAGSTRIGSFVLAGAKWTSNLDALNLGLGLHVRRHLDCIPGEQLRLRPFVLNVLRNFTSLFQQVEARLRERGEYFRGNAGRFYCGLDGIRFMQQVGMERSQSEVLAQAGETFNQVRAKALQILGEAKSAAQVEPLPLSAFLAPRALA